MSEKGGKNHSQEQQDHSDACEGHNGGNHTQRKEIKQGCGARLGESKSDAY